MMRREGIASSMPSRDQRRSSRLPGGGGGSSFPQCDLSAEKHTEGKGMYTRMPSRQLLDCNRAADMQDRERNDPGWLPSGSAAPHASTGHHLCHTQRLQRSSIFMFTQSQSPHLLSSVSQILCFTF